MRKPYHHGDLRRSLLQAAEAILDRDGIGALTLREAARRAGVSHAAPRHHFGDLAGLLSALATIGFTRFRETLLAEVAAAGTVPRARQLALGRGYIGFARAHPGLFRLMFSTDRLDWCSAELTEAGGAAFALLTTDDPAAATASTTLDAQQLAAAVARWSGVHGLATLLLDGRLAGIAAKVPGTQAESLIEPVLQLI